MKPVLSVRHLKKTFYTHDKEMLCAVNDVSFDLMQGEILGLVGESGSGKSTIAKLITRLLDPTEGEIYLNGQDILKLKKRDLPQIYSDIQMVFQTPAGSFDPRKTLGYGIGESLRNMRIPKSDRETRVRGLLETCGLTPEFAERYPHEVSGGQCQRAAIARALACDPKVLILDEATSSLDANIQEQILELLKTLRNEKNISYLFICHNPALVKEFCDRVLFLHDGSLGETAYSLGRSEISSIK